MRPLATAALVAAAALALAVPAAAAPPQQGVLVPGRSLGGILLGDTAKQVLARWGRGFGICRSCTEPTWYYNFVPFRPAGAGVSFGGGRVDAVFTLWSPSGWRTTRGLKLGDPVARVTALYGALSRTDCAGYYALTLPQARTTTVFYVTGETLWGFGLTRRGAPPCR